MMMSKTKPGARQRLAWIFRRFNRNEKGATAVEFAMIAGPFFLLIFAIIETSIFFFAGQVLETSVDNIGRKVRTGEINADNTTEAQFKTMICQSAAVLFDCDGIHVDLTVAATFAAIPDAAAPVVDVAVDLAAFQYTPPEASKIIKLTVMYEWPLVTNYVVSGMSSLSNGNALLTTIAVFRTEPY